MPVANRRLTCLGNNTVEASKATCCLVRKRLKQIRNQELFQPRIPGIRHVLSDLKERRGGGAKKNQTKQNHAMKRLNLPPSMGLSVCLSANSGSRWFQRQIHLCAPCLSLVARRGDVQPRSHALNLTCELLALGDAKNRDKCHSRSSQRVAKHTQHRK